MIDLYITPATMMVLKRRFPEIHALTIPKVGLNFAVQVSPETYYMLLDHCQPSDPTSLQNAVLAKCFDLA